jgi:hypothetical protein
MVIDNLFGAKYFSAPDLTSEYIQFNMISSDVPQKEKKKQIGIYQTAFNTHNGKYERKVLTIGLSIAPAVLQAEVNQFCGPYSQARVHSFGLYPNLLRDREKTLPAFTRGVKHHKKCNVQKPESVRLIL